MEAELTELPEDEALELLQSIGQTESGIQALARVGFATLGLQTLPDGRAQGKPGLDDSAGATAPRQPASSTPTSRRALSRPR